MGGFDGALTLSGTLKLPFRSQLIKNILRNRHTYIMTNASNEGICVVFDRKKQHNLGLPTFKSPQSTKILIGLTR